jgi:hypothetical protein
MVYLCAHSVLFTTFLKYLLLRRGSCVGGWAQGALLCCPSKAPLSVPNMLQIIQKDYDIASCTSPERNSLGTAFVYGHSYRPMR